MKLATFILALFSLSFPLFAQKTLEGTYVTTQSDRSFETEIFHFEPNNRFVYISFHCQGETVGFGTYQLNKKKLTLNFETCTDCPKFIDISTKQTNADSLTINLELKDFYPYRELISGGYATIKNGDAYERVADQNSTHEKLQAKVSASDTTRTFRMNVSFYNDPILFEIPPNITEISGTLTFANLWFYTNSKVKEYKIKRINATGFVYENRSYRFNNKKLGKNGLKNILKKFLPENHEDFYEFCQTYFLNKK